MNHLESYLEHIGFKGSQEVDLETLTQLHRLHTLTFPFENLTPFLHKEVVLDFEHVHDKFIALNRGGYCFEQNLLFANVLELMGFKLRRLGGRVVWNKDENLITSRTHMLLLVTIEDQEYIADVGFGGLTLTTPIKFQTGLIQKTTHEDFRIERIEEDYKIQALVNGVWKTLYRFDLTQQYAIDYGIANFYLYTHPESIFRLNLISAKPVEGGRVALSNNQFTYYPLGGEPQKKILESPEEILLTLRDVFKLEILESDLLLSKLREICKNSIA